MNRMERPAQGHKAFSWGRSLQKIIFTGLLMGFSLQGKTAEEAKTPTHYNWSFEDVLGTFDRASAQRGFQVFKEVCAACHGLSLVRYRNLMSLGFSEKEVKAIAAQYNMQDGPDDMGEMFERNARPADRFVNPYSNDNEARANNNGAYPPDLSVITKARKYGADYIYNLLLGYVEPPKGVEVGNGMYYPHEKWINSITHMLPTVVTMGTQNIRL